MNISISLALLCAVESSAASEPASQPSTQPATEAAPGPTIVFGGYVEAFYSWNARNPSNRVNAYRGLDGRANNITLSNAVLDMKASYFGFALRLALQAGSTPETYYSAEPSLAPSSGQAGLSADVWKHIQQATASYTAPLGAGLTLEAGLFLSPVGAESVASKDNWSLSYGIVANALPFFHLGARASYPVSKSATVAVFVVNGYGGAVDNNAEKSFGASVYWEAATWATLKLVYLGGVERNAGAAEGRALRHLLDLWVLLKLHPMFEAQLHVDAAFEPNAFGLSSWIAAAAFVRFKPLAWLAFALRADVLNDRRAPGAALVLLPTDLMASVSATAEVRLIEHFSIKLEYRHDMANAPIFFAGTVVTDEDTGAEIATSPVQDTLSLGVAAWF